MVIETKRLIIRNYKDTDLHDVSLYLLDEEQMYYLPESFEDSQAVESFMKEKAQTIYVVIEKSSQKVIGHLSFYPFFQDHSYEIGWIFHKDATHKGYAYEAAYALMDYGFKTLNIHRIIATAQPENTGSWKLMEKLKMRREAHFKQCIPYQEMWWDEYYYAILKDEW